MDSDLLRQRRNLLLISCGLILYYLAGVEIESVGLLGTQLSVKNPHILLAFSWLLWLYFLIRYHQYWRAKNHKEVRLAFHDALRRRTHSHATSERMSRKLGHNNALYSIGFNGLRPYYYHLKANTRAGMDRVPIESVHPLRYIKWVISAALEVVVQTKHFTDYLLPLLLAVATPAIALASHQGFFE